MTIVLGLLASVFYGVGDFAGGFGSRRVGALTLLLYSYPVGAVLMTVLLFAFPGHLSGHVWVFGILGGLAGLLGVIVMYDLMTYAPINVVSPVTAVLAAIVPVVVGLGIGERPATVAWLGIALGLLAVVLVSRTEDLGRRAEAARPGRTAALRVIALSLVAGLGFGMYFVFLARAGGGSGLWPLTISRWTSALLILPLARARGSIAGVDGRSLTIVALAGSCDALANMFFLLATHAGLLSLASVLTSLYPATTVLLAVTLLHERLSWTQRGGLALAAAAIVLITV